MALSHDCSRAVKCSCLCSLVVLRNYFGKYCETYCEVTRRDRIVIVNRYCNMFISLEGNVMLEPCCEIKVPVAKTCNKGLVKQRHIHSLASLSRDVNHSDFSGIIPVSRPTTTF